MPGTFGKGWRGAVAELKNLQLMIIECVLQNHSGRIEWNDNQLCDAFLEWTWASLPLRPLS
jgi:hypothetical protein